VSTPETPPAPAADAQPARSTAEVRALVDAIPYCRFLGITVEDGADGGIVSRLCFGPQIIGNAALPAIHGGAIGAFLETAAIVELLRISPADGALPKPVDLTIAYLRSARAVDTLARTIVTKHGRRVMNVRVEAWQDDPARPVATAQGHFLVARDDA
jgi:uncharacterized protein (TIGR00369 family)